MRESISRPGGTWIRLGNLLSKPLTGRFSLLVAISGALVLVHLAFFPWGIELSGDQTAQIEAARSLATEGHLRVGLHWARASGVDVDLANDNRTTLHWFPPGYSCLVAAFVKLGLGFASAALVLHVLNWFAFNVFWLLWLRAIRFSALLGAGILFLFSLARYPSTTTDPFTMTAAAGLFWIAALPRRNRLHWLLAATLLAAAIWVRNAFVVFLPVWICYFGIAWWRKSESWRAFSCACLALVPSLLVIWIVRTLVLEGRDPYEGLGHVPTQWSHLWKAVYYAAIGGWSPHSLPLKAGAALLVVAGMLAAFRYVRVNGLMGTTREVPSWAVLTGLTQVATVAFLVLVQLRYSGMYDPDVPAFATIRFYALPSVASVCLLGVLWVRLFPGGTLLWLALIAFLAICALDWGNANRRTMRDTRSPWSNGFLYPKDCLQLFSCLEQQDHLDYVVSSDIMLNFVIPGNRLYPSNLRSIAVSPGIRMAVVVDRESLQLPLEKKLLAAGGHLVSESHVAAYTLRVYEVQSLSMSTLQR